MMYRLADEWFAAKLDSVSRRSKEVNMKDSEKKKSTGDATPPRGSATHSAGSTPGGAGAGKKKAGRTTPKGAKPKSNPTPTAEEKQAHDDQHIVLRVSRQLNDGKEPAHIRSSIPPDALAMGKDRLRRAAEALGIGVSRHLRNFFHVKGGNMASYTTESAPGPSGKVLASSTASGRTGDASTAKAKTGDTSTSTSGAPKAKTPHVRKTTGDATGDASPKAAAARSVVPSPARSTGLPRLETVDHASAGGDPTDEDVDDEGSTATHEEGVGHGQADLHGGDVVGDDGWDSRDREYIPPELVYSRGFPTRKNYADHQSGAADAWKEAWYDSAVFWELGHDDACCLEDFPGTPAQIKIKDTVWTINPACGHLSRGVDYHQLCRACQLLARRRLCCTVFANDCEAGKELFSNDTNQFLKIKKMRKKNWEQIRDRGIKVFIKWLGQDEELALSATARLALAYGMGATELETSLNVIRHLGKRVGVSNADAVIKLWVEKGRKIGSFGASHQSEVKVTPLYMFGDREYAIWKAKKEREDAKPTSAVVPSKAAGPSGSKTISGGAPPRGQKRQRGASESDDSSRERGGGSSTSHPSAPIFASPPSAGVTPIKKGRGKGRKKEPELVYLPGTQVVGDGQHIITRTPYDESEAYRQETDYVRLHLGSRADVPKMVHSRRKLHTDEVCSDVRPYLPLHDTLKEAFEFADERRAQEVGAAGRRIPYTTTWPLETCSPLMYGREEALLASRPILIPSLHVKNTPNDLRKDTPLVTTVEAQSASEEIGRVHAHDVNTMLHAVGNLRAELDRFLTGGVFEQEAVRRVKEAEEELTQAGGLAATSAAEAVQLAVYNRRWSLLHGAAPDIKRVMLAAPVLGCSSATGAVTVVKENEEAARLKIKKERKSGPDLTPAPEPEEVIDLDGELLDNTVGFNPDENLSSEELFNRPDSVFTCDEDLVEFINEYFVHHESGPDSTTVDHPTELDSRQFWHMGKPHLVLPTPPPWGKIIVTTQPRCNC